MPRSLAQAEASRTNGARSQGPTSAAGKRRSAQNARTHGLRARSPLPPKPGQASAHAAMERSLLDRFRPASPSEAAACARIVQASWNCHQAACLEADFWRDRHGGPSQDRPGQDRPSQDRPRLGLASLLRYLAATEKALHLALLDFARLRRGLTAGTNEPEAPARPGRAASPGPAAPAGRPQEAAASALIRQRTNEPGRQPIPVRGTARPNLSRSHEPACRTNEPGRQPVPVRGAARPDLHRSRQPARRTNEPGPPTPFLPTPLLPAARTAAGAGVPPLGQESVPAGVIRRTNEPERAASPRQDPALPASRPAVPPGSGPKPPGLVAPIPPDAAQPVRPPSASSILPAIRDRPAAHPSGEVLTKGEQEGRPGPGDLPAGAGLNRRERRHLAAMVRRAGKARPGT